MTNAVVTTEPQKHLMLYMAEKYSLREEEFKSTVRKTCGLPTATAEEFAAFLIVAKTYNLNPILREIFAFPKKGGGIVPIVSVDGWINLINSHAQCDGWEFEDHHDDDRALVSITCKMHRKDRKFPVTVTEYLSECIRPTDPWKMQHRMLRHKALIQAARYAFGFAGIYDEDEGQKIAEGPRDAGPPRDGGPPKSDVIEGEIVQEGAHQQVVWDDKKDAQADIDSAHARENEERPGSETSGDPVDDIEDDGSAEDGFVDEPGPEAPYFEPVKLSSDGYTTVTWAEKYIPMMETSRTLQEVYKWVDLNNVLLGAIKNKNPAVSAKIKAATEARMKVLREAGALSQAKSPETTQRDAGPPRAAAAKTEPKASKPKAKAKQVEIPNREPADEKPDTILKWVDAVLARIEDADQYAYEVETRIEPYRAKLDFPPDVAEFEKILRNHEARFN